MTAPKGFGSEWVCIVQAFSEESAARERELADGLNEAERRWRPVKNGFTDDRPRLVFAV